MVPKHELWPDKLTAPTHSLGPAVTDTLSDTAVCPRFTELGQEIPPLDQQTPQALAAHHQAEIEKWWPGQSSRAQGSKRSRCAEL